MKNIIVVALISLLVSTAHASEVYIDQAGGALTIDILQQNGANRVNTEDNPAIVAGNDISITTVQDGDGNEIDMFFQLGADTTTFDYSALGDLNTIVINVYGGISNSFTASLIGSENIVTVCKTYTNSICNGIVVNETTTNLNVTGDSNEINFAYDSGNATNNLNVGQTTSSNFNTINLTQTTVNGYNNVNLTLDGNSNTVDITQN